MRSFEQGDITVVRAVLPKPDEVSERILVLRRSLSSKRHAGLWELPGGKREKKDGVPVPENLNAPEDIAPDYLLTAGIREIQEETGFTVRFQNNGLSLVERRIMTGGELAGKLLVAYAGVARYEEGNFELSDEHIDEAWLTPFEILSKLKITPATSHALALYENLELGIADHPNARAA